MKFQVKDTIPFPRDLVYTTTRDKLPELARYLTEIESVTMQTRSEEGDVVKMVNLWKGKAEIPKIAQSYIRPEMLQWTDYATWTASKNTCDWNMVIGFFPEAITARGTNTWVVDGNQTTAIIDGEFIVHPDKVPGVPRLMQKAVAEVVERLVVNLIKPNLSKTNEGVTAYLKANP